MKRIGNLAVFVVPYFEDLIGHFPEAQQELIRDCERVIGMHHSFGDEYLTISLPDAQKVFEKALSRGYLPGHFGPEDTLQWGERSGFSPKRRTFLRFFVNRIFDASGVLLPSACAASVKAVIGVLALYKKVKMPCTKERIQDEVDQYYHNDETLRRPSCDWSGGFFDRCSMVDGSVEHVSEDLFGHVQPGSRRLLELCQRVADVVASNLGLFSRDTLLHKHGTGAVADSEYGGDKYRFPTWSQRLENIFPSFELGAANVRLAAEETYSLFRDAEAPAKQLAVPKTQKGPRLIASEPTSHMWIQQGILGALETALEKSLLRHCVDLHDQRPSQKLAVQASLSRELCTVDLKSASDRLSLWTVERLFRSNVSLLVLLAAARSVWVKSGPKVDERRRYLVLRKFANQGSALTFPIQTIAYAILCITAVLYTSRTKLKSVNVSTVTKAAKCVRVFGDDLILPTRALPVLADLLEFNQLQVNKGKTHFSGNFAESCGTRAFRGTVVTPGYLTCVSSNPTPEEISALVQVSNNFAREWMFHTSNVVLSLVPHKFRKELHATRLLAGLSLWTFLPGLPPGTRTYYNSRLCREEVKTVSVSIEPKTSKRDNWASLLQYFTQAGPSYVPPIDSIVPLDEDNRPQYCKPQLSDLLGHMREPTVSRVGFTVSMTEKVSVRRVPLLGLEISDIIPK